MITYMKVKVKGKVYSPFWTKVRAKLKEIKWLF